MDLDLWNCFGRKKTLSYNRRNTISTSNLPNMTEIMLKRTNKPTPFIHQSTVTNNLATQSRPRSDCSRTNLICIFWMHYCNCHLNCSIFRTLQVRRELSIFLLKIVLSPLIRTVSTTLLRCGDLTKRENKKKVSQYYVPKKQKYIKIGTHY